MKLKDYEFDVVVVGFGAAGACAAIAAAEHGARVLVVDRSLGGGASALSGGVVYAGGGTRYQHEAGYEDTPDNMYNYLRQEVAGAVDDQTLHRFCDESVQRLSWLERHGARFAASLCDYKTSYPTDRHYLYFSGNERAYPYCLQATPAPRGHRQVAKGMGSGRALWRALCQSAEQLGVVFSPLTRAEQLLIEASGVAGVRCRSVTDHGSLLRKYYCVAAPLRSKLINWAPGFARMLPTGEARLWRRSSDLTIRASNVILAAGGFAFNGDMVRRHAPAYAGISPLGTEGDDGGGMMLGTSVGGATGYLHRVAGWRFLSPPAAMLEGITVGVSGERIANEDLYGATHTDVMVRDFGGRGFLILDSAMWKRARAQFLSQTSSLQRIQLAAVFTIERRKATTLRGLAVKLGISASGLAETVAAYNSALNGGLEDPAHKASSMCRPLTRAPFYGLDISIRPSMSYFVPGITLGGLRVDGASGEVLTDNGNRIRGLYAAGRTAVGVCSNSYISGLSLADCVFSGKRAGEHAAAFQLSAAP
ncbi:FAD-binding protein [Mycobacterium intracellulare]|uniref:FAD-binding protein n=1 Tax=Mycobacterium intracellulare TaxID=1767 RepID=A0AAE4UFI4_MYCIT|nr:FAD-binding protein [Mycobacterium intracellulare]MCA2321642.1 FAD-binding protein [Mycobacterium intracellulare]MCA2343991.1 FAD-binding protein [Mycobacterium intracellulare]MDV6979455.1 FAD-binding protein [Mycobacterium intracellulare]MDV6984958.1 FAD-binding protein [Mycobacterium intracellulare]MDV7015223.1 FAD-binding protein [Mycobacterium intracellulare]